ncbi:hypothetical protein MD535_26045, partial [Vibrio sp. ZSDZ65]|nr:hypothetical protein [Vibrio qingdaonensis]
LSALKAELLKAHWIAISSFARRTPLSDAQLNAYPKLKAQLDKHAFPEGKKVNRASYQQVQDDVPLARHLSYVPVEP